MTQITTSTKELKLNPIQEFRSNTTTETQNQKPITDLNWEKLNSEQHTGNKGKKTIDGED